MDFVIFTAIAALMGMGVGGGGLLVIWLTLVESVPQLTAQGLNLYFFIFASAASLPVHIGRRKIDGRSVFVLASFGAASSMIGCYLATVSGEGLVRTVFAWLLIVSGALALGRQGIDAIRQRKTVGARKSGKRRKNIGNR